MAARTRITKQTFGADLAGTPGAKDFASAVDELLKAAADANFRASHAACSSQWSVCSGSIDRLKSVTLPSRRRFWARIQVSWPHAFMRIHPLSSSHDSSSLLASCRLTHVFLPCEAVNM